jgi:hypothetical protein
LVDINIQAEKSEGCIEAARETDVPASVIHYDRHFQLFGEQLSLPNDEDGLSDIWSVPWSDLMMAMFVLFAALLAVNTMNPKIEIRYKSEPIPERHEIEKEKIVTEETLVQAPSFEPLMQINVFDRSQDAILET